MAVELGCKVFNFNYLDQLSVFKFFKERAPGPFFFHGFLRPISRAREIENDAFHGHFTG